MSQGCVIITGANIGIGLEIARKFYDKGRDVILACRSEEKANLAIEDIKKSSISDHGSLSFLLLDLSSLTSVRNFVSEFQKRNTPLQILVNNAGVLLSGKGKDSMQFSEEGYELTVATNHIGHFLLTKLLLDDIKAGFDSFGDARIITVSSGVHDCETLKLGNQPFDINNVFLNEENTYSGFQAYGNSKFMNVLFTYGLARQLGENNVTATCLDPGLIPSTGLDRHGNFLMKLFLRFFWLFAGRITSQEAASHVYNYATSTELSGVTSKYFQNGVETQSHKDTYDEQLQDKLWSLTEGLVKPNAF